MKPDARKYVLALAASTVLNGLLVYQWVREGNLGDVPPRRPSDLATRVPGDVALREVNKTEGIDALSMRLKSAGMPPWAVNAVLDLHIDELFAQRESRLLQIADHKVWWQSHDVTESLDTAFARIDLQREKNAMRLKYLVQGAPGNSSSTPTSDSVSSILEDYRIFKQEFLSGSHRRSLLPEEQRLISYLDDQRHRDLLAIMSPQSAGEVEFRESNAFRMTRAHSKFVDLSEDEFRKVANLYGSFGESLSPRILEDASFKKGLLDAIGQEKGLAYLQSLDPEYQKLRLITAASQNDRAVADNIYALRGTLQTEVKRIQSSEELSAQEKETAIHALTADFRNKATSALGPDAGAQYLSHSKSWLDALSSRSSRGAGLRTVKQK